MASDLGMFGSPTGLVRYEEMARQRAEAQQALAQAAMAPAHARLYETQAGKLEEEAAQERRMAELAVAAQRPGAAASGMSFEELPVSRRPVASQLENLAEMAIGAGMIEKGSKLAAGAALIRSREANALARRASAVKTSLDAQKALADLIGRAFADVKDQAAFDAANRFYEFNAGEPSPYSGMVYSPQLVDAVRQNALSVKDQADLAESQARRKGTEAYRQSRLGQLDYDQILREARLAVMEAREKRQAKAGAGRAIAGPSASEVDQAKKLITKDFPGLPSADSKEAAFAVASEARALRKANPALSADEALRRAYMQARQTGDFETTSEGVAGYGRKDVFKGGGKTAESPAPLPTDAKRLAKGRFYINNLGLVAKWTGQGFEVVGGGRALSEDNGSPDNEDDEDEEE